MASFIQMYIFYGLTYIFDEKRPRRRHGTLQKPIYTYNEQAV